MRRVGLVQLASRIEHSGALAVASICFFALSLLASLPMVASALGEAAAGSLRNVGLAGTYALSGLPQAVSSVALAAGGQLDTHVLMAAAVVATLCLGMAQEGALLLLLFQVSHFLEERFTTRAQGSLERLFAAMPQRATLVALSPAAAATEETGPSGAASVGAGGGAGPDLASCVEVLAEEVAVGQLVLVRPGEQVPLDGEVVWGTASVSAAHISGESQPARVTPGAWLPAGALSADGALVLRATARAADSTPARIARMAAAAQASKPRLQRQLDMIGAVWSRAVLAATLVSGLALAAAGVPLLEAPGGALYRALGVLVAGSPCAVVLVPLAYVCALATVTRRGVLLKGASALDALASVSMVALDKTGTITTGELRLTEASLLEPATTAPTGEAGSGAPVTPAAAHSLLPLLRGGATALASLPSLSLDSDTEAPTPGGAAEAAPSTPLQLHWPELAVRCAAALSRASSHPVSRAVVEAGGELARGVRVDGFEQVPGSGVRGVCRLGGDAFSVAFGSQDFAEAALASAASHSSGAATAAAALRSHLAAAAGGASAVKAVSVLVLEPLADGRDPRVAVFSFEDVVRPGAEAAVGALTDGSWRQPPGAGGRRAAESSASKRVVMLTGDNSAVASAVASGVGIAEFRAGMMPQDKLDYVQREQRERAADGASGGGGVLMMGDGINDAPALAAAHVGVAVAASPRDLVAAAADVIVLNGQGAAALPWLLRTADRTQAIVRQNLALSLTAMVAATLPTLAGAFPLWLAVLLHEGSTLAVALNSLRLLLPEEGEGESEEQGGRRGPLGSLAAVWTGLKELAADPHHHHHHDHDHDHHHGHDHDHHDHHHGHDHHHHHHHDHHHHQEHAEGAASGHHHHHHDHHHHHEDSMAKEKPGSRSNGHVSNGHNDHSNHHHDRSHHERDHDQAVAGVQAAAASSATPSSGAGVCDAGGQAAAPITVQINVGSSARPDVSAAAVTATVTEFAGGRAGRPGGAASASAACPLRCCSGGVGGWGSAAARLGPLLAACNGSGNGFGALEAGEAGAATSGGAMSGRSRQLRRRYGALRVAVGAVGLVGAAAAGLSEEAAGPRTR
ncbi:hypothetical protein GPECTOR_28g790 [Gonium pectorale]|uniref:P-type ATPase A domain-containing protein n=1 Tax=Gonium pectorale TaxID=33097 RepID=A0A150GF27_GONPE|nr:hypothetical protein GPECTOR_28g790 [Gonium pectorale]|eukprot:KXZ48383.1 hypothetical protein GPECTOR_28g790 [Gonium pectorale]